MTAQPVRPDIADPFHEFVLAGSPLARFQRYLMVPSNTFRKNGTWSAGTRPHAAAS
jgi:hypothetical protein